MVLPASKENQNRLGFKSSSSKTAANAPKSPGGIDRLKKKASTVEKSDQGNPDEVLTGEEIEKLAIKEEDLQKLRQSQDNSDASSLKSTQPHQTMRYSIKKSQPVAKQQAPRKKVIVARRAPPNAHMKPIDYSGPAGPKYTGEGQIIPHSIVGSVDDFIKEAVRQQHVPIESPIVEAGLQQSPTPLDVRPVSHHGPSPLPKIQMAINQENSLMNWRRKMADRRKQQGYISSLLQKPVDRLVMNQSDAYRQVQETRHLLDRSIPAVDAGKGYRVGSEFWQQHESFGNELGGIKMTLTKTERGEPVVFERIGKPRGVLAEIGALDNEQTADPRRGWHSSSYLATRTKQLDPIMKQLVPHEPDMSEIEVTPHKLNNDFDPSDYREDHNGYPPITLDNNQDPQTEDPLSKYPDTIPEPIFGPSIVIGGQRASWENEEADKGIECRVTFDTVAGQRLTSHLEFVNDGTTVIYYDWRKVPRKPAFAELKRDQVQRFYFNTSGGVVLPNETVKVPFVFKSPNAGIFTEEWQLETKPLLLGGADIKVTLRGVASASESENPEKKRILKELAHNEAMVTAQQILNQILNSIRTPDRSPSPVDCYITEQEIFERRNPGCTYDHETVIELKNLYKQLFPEDKQSEVEWNLSLSELRDCVSAVPEEDAREELLSGLNNVVSRLTIPPFTPAQNKMYATCRCLLQETIDEIISCSLFVRKIMNMPDIIMENINDNETNVTIQAPTKPDPKVQSAKSYKSQSSAGNPEDKKGKGKKGTAKDDGKGKKGGKGGKDAKDSARPKSKDVKGGKGKGTASPTKESLSVERDIGSKTPSNANIAATDAIDPVTKKKYNEKMYSQVYGLLLQTVDKMTLLFEEIKQEE